ncbi:MAG: NAD-dependent dihydropyrimidine dehydrogenase subunit PreA [Candidatus Latescibacterota bacterium]|nr:MAG: NAD-dependent dihydropyrimidine dehydrogenase subunit PreA [Candidatus Latescibacterota bacterium]
MADLSVRFAGIYSPNPFWLASGPPTNSGDQVKRAFDLGWGGAVWKTVGEPIINVCSRYSSVDYGSHRMMGLNNIELISDRPIADNLREIAEVKKLYPRHAVIVSLMVESKREAWHDIVRRTEDTGADGLELNFGCPHGMSERGMGAAVGQVPEYTTQIVEWVKEVARTPVIVKLTPNVTDVRYPGRAAVRGGADGLSLINTINSITGIDLDDFTPRPKVGGRSSHGGYCGPAVKPIALNMVAQIAGDDACRVPLSGIGGISTWRDAAEFIALGCVTVQVCTAAMHYGFRIVEDLADGLANWMDERGFKRIEDFRGKALPRVSDWGDLDLNYKTVAQIDEKLCIGCQLCYVACQDTAHQCIYVGEASGASEGDSAAAEARAADGARRALGIAASAGHAPTWVPEPFQVRGEPIHTLVSGHGLLGDEAREVRVPWVKQDDCVGCNLCMLVCPVPDCITMVEQDTGKPPMSWNQFQRQARD